MGKNKIIALFILFLPGMVFAQEGEYVEVQDFETWTSIGLKFKPTKKWTFGLQEQMRLDNNSTEIKGFFTQLSGDYELFKNFEAGIGLRFIQKNDNQGKVQGYEHYFRYQFDASYKHKIERFSFKYRFRFQNRNEIGVSKAEGDIATNYLRLKAKAGYNIKNWKLDPFISGEIFNQREDGINYGLTDYRITIGTSYKFKDAGKIGLYYRMEQEINTSYPMTTHILRLKYTYTFKNKKK